jgi:PAS domain S-box-containing protein
MAALGAGVFVVPDLAAGLWAAIGLLSAAAIGYGVRTHAPLSRLPWWLLAGAVLAMAVGDVLYAVGQADGGVALTLADACYLAMFPLVGVGLVRMTRSSVVLPDRARVLDLLTFTCAAVLVAWVLVGGPALATPGLSGAGKSMMAANTLGGLLVLITVVRLGVAARRSWAVALLATGGVGLLTADIWYALTQLTGGFRPGHPAELGYLVFYACWGAAALHPSMTVLTEPVDTWPTRLPARRAALLSGSLAVPPGLLLVESATGGVHDGPLIAAASLIMLFLVVIRLTDAIGRYRRSLVRERALRRACATLLGAADAAQVASAARTAVRALLPGSHTYEVAIVDADSGRLPAVPTGRRTRLIDAGLLDPAVRGLLGAAEAALICPLTLDGRPPGPAPQAVAVVVAGPRAALVTTRNAIEVLAAQAALALDRISLTEVMNRRDSDQYLRTIVRNATDVVLIVEPDGEIRYASPSLATVVGVDPATLPALPDLVDPDDRGRLDDTLRRADPEGVRDVWSLRRADGGRAIVEVSCRDLRGDRMVRGYVITLRDVTDRRRHEQALIRQALEASPAGQNRHSAAMKFR